MDFEGLKPYPTFLSLAPSSISVSISLPLSLLSASLSFSVSLSVLLCLYLSLCLCLSLMSQRDREAEREYKNIENIENMKAGMLGNPVWVFSPKAIWRNHNTQ